MDYKQFLENYAKKNNFHFSQIDENTYKINSTNNLLKIYFRQTGEILDGWGCFIDFSDPISLNELEKYLDTTLLNNQLILGLDANYNIIEQAEAPTLYNIEKDCFVDDIKYCLASTFSTPAKLYELKNNMVVESPMIEINNPIKKLQEIFTQKNIPYKIQPLYLGEIETFDKLVLDKGENVLNITSNFCGSKLILEKESKELDFSVYKQKTIDIKTTKLEEITFDL